MPFILGFLGNIVRVIFTRSAAMFTGFAVSFLGPAVQTIVKAFSSLAKIAIVIAAIVLAVAVFSVAVDGVLSLLAISAPADLIEVGRMFMPSNLSTCISIVVLVRLKSLVFFWVVRFSEKLERS